MNVNTGEMKLFDALTTKEKKSGDWLKLSDALAEQVEPLAPRERLAHMRNKPCPCGSGAKFKKCCMGNR